MAPKVQISRDIFRLSGASRRDPEIDRWLDECPEELGDIARTWFERLRGCGPDVRELIHDGCPVACVEDAAFGYVDVFTAHVNVGFFQGASLRDPAFLLQGSGTCMRHVKLRPGVAVKESSLEALIATAYADIKGRLSAGR
jgi:hypothetical protein